MPICRRSCSWSTPTPGIMSAPEYSNPAKTDRTDGRWVCVGARNAPNSITGSGGEVETIRSKRSKRIVRTAVCL